MFTAYQSVIQIPAPLARHKEEIQKTKDFTSYPLFFLLSLFIQWSAVSVLCTIWKLVRNVGSQVHPRPSAPESAPEQDSKAIYTSINIWETIDNSFFTVLPSEIIIVCKG